MPYTMKLEFQGQRPVATGAFGFRFPLRRCTCGGPALGTAHAPDCAFELDAEEAKASFKDAVYGGLVAEGFAEDDAIAEAALAT